MSDPVEAVAPFVNIVLAAALVVSAWRLLRGPTLADRVVALEVASAVMIAILLVAAVREQEPTFVDIALLVALVSFVTTLAFSRYIGGPNPRD